MRRPLTDPTRLARHLAALGNSPSLASLRGDLVALSSELPEGPAGLDPTFWQGEIQQILATKTLERANYYVKRLVKAVTEERTNGVNDLNLNRWKAYEDIQTDSLWLIDRRDATGVHRAEYWGNFVPQIPNQMIRRYTKKGDWVVDTFAGLGTTLIEAQRLGRNCLGIELQPDIVDRARALIASEPNASGAHSRVEPGDAGAVDYKALLTACGTEKAQLIVMHPPYFDIIRFSEDQRDLSNLKSVDSFLDALARIGARVCEILESGRHLVLVLGDKYSKGEWIPLGFLAMNALLKGGLRLKSIVVKNFEDTTAKRNQQDLWRYRALAGGFYVFKHEYIFVFQKP